MASLLVRLACFSCLLLTWGEITSAQSYDDFDDIMAEETVDANEKKGKDGIAARHGLLDFVQIWPPRPVQYWPPRPSPPPPAFPQYPPTPAYPQYPTTTPTPAPYQRPAWLEPGVVGSVINFFQDLPEVIAALRQKQLHPSFKSLFDYMMGEKRHPRGVKGAMEDILQNFGTFYNVLRIRLSRM